MKLIHHHVKYKEIHGIDEVVILTHAEHVRLHKRLRREGKCNIPRDELNKISHKASVRLESSKSYCKNYRQTHKELYRQYDKSLPRASWRRKYRKDNLKVVDFTNITLELNVQLFECITYNLQTDHIHVSSRFHTTKGKLKIIEEK